MTEEIKPGDLSQVVVLIDLHTAVTSMAINNELYLKSNVPLVLQTVGKTSANSSTNYYDARYPGMKLTYCIQAEVIIQRKYNNATEIHLLLQ